MTMGNLWLVGLSFSLFFGIFLILRSLFRKRQFNYCFVSFDDQGAIKDGSDNFFNLIKYKKEEILGSEFLEEIVHPKDRYKVSERLKLISDTEMKKDNFLFRLIDRSGAPIWIKVLNISATNSKGKKIFRIEFDFDLEWVNLLTTLEKDIWFKDYLLDNVPINIYIKNKKSQKTYINRSELNYSGFSTKEEVLGKSDWDLYPFDTAKISIEEDEKIFSTATPFIGEVKKNVRYNSSPTWFHTSKIPILKDGETVGLMGMSYDVTNLITKDQLIEEKNKKLQATQKELKKRIKQLDKVNKSLEESKKRTDELLDANNKFLSRFSHEIKTPIHTIKGFAYLLSTTDLNPKQKEFLSYLVNSSASLDTLVNKVFDFSSFELGLVELNLQQTNLEVFFQNLVFSMSKMVEKKPELSFIYEFDQELPMDVSLDPIRLKQILEHLLMNAVNYTSSGVISFRMKNLSSSNGFESIRFEIEDTGKGISSESLNHIFDPFFHTSEVHLEGDPEHGMGLAVCNAILKLMNSRLQVESTLGKGSLFFFELILRKN
jgi:PAS domain S-box-containing protein